MLLIVSVSVWEFGIFVLGLKIGTGSGYVVRRKAVEEIGGIPTASISEDTGTSAMLLGKGWTVAFIDEVLQVGEMVINLSLHFSILETDIRFQPDTLMGHVKQRTRWTIGISSYIHVRSYIV